MPFLPFEDAREYVRKLNLKDVKAWFEYAKSEARPDDIPYSPREVYKDKGWINMSDWLGSGRSRYLTKRSDEKILSFEEAREYVRSLKLGGQPQWILYCKSGKRPANIPAAPDKAYKDKGWIGYGDWTGSGKKRSSKLFSFQKAREFARSLGLRGERQWKEYCKSGKRPDYIPAEPDKSFDDEWKGWSDWLGGDGFGRFKPFEEAREYVRSLKLGGQPQWFEYIRSGNKPDDIPSSPNLVYKGKGWIGYGDWTGSGRTRKYKKIDDKKSDFLPFEEARDYIRLLKLKNVKEWKKYSKSNDRPHNIPKNPKDVYKHQWIDSRDWLGIKEKEYLPFEEARAYIRSLNLGGQKQWYEYIRTGNKPDNIPSTPWEVYKGKGWIGYGDWLGTERLRPTSFRPFEQAREFTRSLLLNGQEEWNEFVKTEKKPKDIPTQPDKTYQNEWIDWYDWLGKEDTSWSVKRVKELLKDLIKSGVIYQWDEAVLYSFLLRKGVLNISSRHGNFFKDLIKACKSEEGRKIVEEYSQSDSTEPPDLSEYAGINGELESETLSKINTEDNYEDQELKEATTDELSKLVDNKDPLDYGKIRNVEQVLDNTQILESISVDDEAMQFLVNYSVNELWKAAFRDEVTAVSKIRNQHRNNNKYHDTVLDIFLADYDGTKAIQIPSGYSFPRLPHLMQLYVAYKIKTSHYFGNFSGTGAGKTLSAILASRVINSKVTVIVCPNDVVEYWKKSIMEIFPDSYVKTGKEAFYEERQDDKYKYLVLNYDKFSQEDSPNLIVTLAEQKIDFVILDEIHFSKVRDENISQRRQNLEGLLSYIRNKNEEVRVLGLSATPVVNNLMEGRSLLELITGKVYDDISTRPTVPNAVTLYEKLSTISIREIPEYNIEIDTEFSDVVLQDYKNLNILQLKSNPLSIEQILTDVRLPEIVKRISGQTIIYSEYVDEIIDKISNAVDKAGYTYALYTGYDRSGLERFLQKRVQVLIASRPIATGIDGLQKICSRLIINTLPWTNAQYQQLIGRLVRQGQEKDKVHIHIIKASIGGYNYDDLKLNRIKFKRTLADCAVDGRLPEKNLVTPSQAAMEAVRWLERLEKGEISTISRKILDMELIPIEIEQRLIKYGDFATLNQKINTETSETTHKRLNDDPEEWMEYHRQYRIARTNWSIIPFNEMIKRIQELSPRLHIGDFGCGEGKIAEAIGDRIHSFDHVAINENVISCDIRSVPLEDKTLDVAIFCLSLMGKNWSEYIKEAKRCLVNNGIIMIADTTKSIKEGRLSSLKEILNSEGYDIYKNEEKGDFTFIEALKL